MGYDDIQPNESVRPNNTMENFKPLDVVAYVPQHANKQDPTPVIEYGVVRSKNRKFIFVMPIKSFFIYGLDEAQAQATGPKDLINLTKGDYYYESGGKIKK